MRASTPTKLPLARFADIIGLHPLHFAQIEAEGARPTQCQNLYYQYPFYPSGYPSREEIAQAIASAEFEVENLVGWRLMPSWEVDERAVLTRPYRPDLIYLAGNNVRGFPQTVTTQWARVISGGQRTTEVLAEAVAIAWTDPDNDGYEETGTITVTIPTSQDECEYQVFYPDKGPDPTWQFRPVRRERAGTTVTFTFRRELAVREEFYSQVTVADIQSLTVNGNNDASFVDTVDVYRVYNDGETQASFLWQNVGVCGCGDDGCPTCGYQAGTGCLTVVNSRLGVVAYQPGSWDADTGQYNSTLWTLGRAPDQARLWYYGGLRDLRETCANDRMPTRWEIMIAQYAATKLSRPFCQCSQVQIQQWAEDLAVVKPGKGSGQTQYQIPQADLTNPLGTTRAALAIVRYLRYASADAAIPRAVNV